MKSKVKHYVSVCLFVAPVVILIVTMVYNVIQIGINPLIAGY